MKTRMTAFLAVLLISGAAHAKVDLVILPTRDTVQLTIYNSADLTLVRESRALTLKQGLNKLQFSWADTLIDPTSLEMRPTAHAGKISIADLTYPPRTRNLGLWNIRSELSGQAPVEITYLTSGLAWRAFYQGTLTADEKTMRLEGYVLVSNTSGEDYENAQTRLVVGKVHILDEIATLARQRYAYGRPGEVDAYAHGGEGEGAPSLFLSKKGVEVAKSLAEIGGRGGLEGRPKEVKKEGLSEYFLYTIEGTETIPNGWSKRLPSFNVAAVPVVNLYKYEEERYGRSVLRFLSFKNDKQHKMGETPIPGGMLRVCRAADAAGHVSYEGQSVFKYIPVDEKVELNLGAVGNVVVKPTLMSFRTDKHTFNNDGNITGWEEIREFKVEANNTRDVPVKVEIQRNFNTPQWSLEKAGDFGQFEKVDLDTVKFSLELAERSRKEFTYTLVTKHAQDRPPEPIAARHAGNVTGASEDEIVKKYTALYAASRMRIKALIRDLSDSDADRRQAAFQEASALDPYLLSALLDRAKGATDPEARKLIAELNDIRLSKTSIHQRAVNAMKQAAGGDAYWQGVLSSMYRRGEWGVPRDFAAARKWAEESAKRGNAMGLYSMASLHLTGLGVEKDEAKADKLFAECAGGLLALAQQGNADAQCDFGWMCGAGRGVERNPVEALKWFRSAADQGLPRAHHNLGASYQGGQGVPADVNEAVKWYRLAAEMGDAPAQYHLGLVYSNGSGVEKNDAKSLKWLSRAAAQGHDDATAELKRRETEGRK